MNQTEARFEREILTPLKASGEVIGWVFESIKLKVGTDTCWFTPDFVVFRADGEIELVDVKGGGPVEDDAMVKIKAAAAQYPQFHWSQWQYARKSWARREFGA